MNIFCIITIIIIGFGLIEAYKETDDLRQRLMNVYEETDDLRQEIRDLRDALKDAIKQNN